MDLTNLTMGDLRKLEAKTGIHLGLDGRERIITKAMCDGAFDDQITAQPSLTTTPNGSIPWYLANYFDPSQIEVIFAKLQATEIFPEAKKGDWTTATAQFLQTEIEGTVSAYGDYSNDGMSNMNVNYPQRQSFHYQTFASWGEKQQAVYGLAKVDWAAGIARSAQEVLNRFQNNSYFFGISGLQNYGILNDPNLSAAISPGTKTAGNGNVWVYNGQINATANEVYNDILALFARLQSQSDGVITFDTPMTLNLSPVSSMALLQTNAPYSTVNLYDMLKKNFPLMRIVIAIQYAAGQNGTALNEVQLIADEVQRPSGGVQKTGECAFTEKLRNHPIIQAASSWMQKKSQGTFGAVIYQPFAIASMTGI